MVATGSGGDIKPPTEPPRLVFSSADPDGEGGDDTLAAPYGGEVSIPITRGGGKLEVTRALAKLDFPVPKSAYLYWHDLSNDRLLKAALRDLGNQSLIARASHPNDMDGYIDVIPTFHDIRNLNDLKSAIKEIKKAAARDELRLHAEDWGQKFTPEVHVLLQQQSPSPLVGSMMGHPHNEGQVDLNYIDIVERERAFKQPNYLGAHWDEDGQLYYRKIDDDSITDAELQEALGWFDKVAQVLGPGIAWQIEIGLRPFLIFQARPFKPKQPAQDFAIPSIYDTDIPRIEANGLVFGITPREGIELPLVIADSSDLWNERVRLPSSSPQPYGLLITGKETDPLPARITYGNLAFAGVVSGQNAYQCHGDYRLLKRADFSMVDYQVHNVTQTGVWYHKPHDLTEFVHSRYWSNGRNAVLIPSSYVHKVI